MYLELHSVPRGVFVNIATCFLGSLPVEEALHADTLCQCLFCLMTIFRGWRVDKDHLIDGFVTYFIMINQLKPTIIIQVLYRGQSGSLTLSACAVNCFATTFDKSL